MRKLMVVLVLAAGGAGVVMSVPSCVEPPDGTMLIDTNNDLVKETLVLDADKDGVPDLDDEGKVIPVNAELYKKAAGVDDVLPPVLTAAGTILGGLGGVVLTAIGAAWRQSRFARTYANTVTHIQMGRQRLQDQGLEGALAVMDEALGSQAPATIKEVAKIKESLGLKLSTVAGNGT